MTTDPINFMILALAVVQIARVVSKLRREQIGFISGLLWLGLWLAIGFFGLFPDVIDPIQDVLNFQKRLNLILVLAVIILYVIVFDLLSRLETMKREEARAIQEAALLNYKFDHESQISKAKMMPPDQFD